VIVAAILLEDWFKDLPEPPVPPLPDIADAVFEITINTAFDGPEGYHSTPLPPVVTAHFPEEGALVAARSIRVVFAASEPLNPGDVESHGITVLGEKSGLVPGITRYDPEHWWVTWEPDGDLPRDELFHVTLGAEAVEDLDGNELPKAFSFTFRTAA
nr:Ig-like domain-containing protein [Thermoanaerobaculia bacterium]